MAIVVSNTMSGVTQEIYDAVTEKVMSGNKLPEGSKVHIAGPVDEGWRVITVWDSQEAFDKFRNETLIPALREAAGDQAVAPAIKTDPVYRLITA